MRRQSWHLRVGSASAAFAVRARFRSEVEDLLPAFNDAFDAWAPDEAVLRIPRLELKLRVASLDELAGALGEALRREAPRQPPAPRRSAAAQKLALLLGYLETGALDWHAAHADAAELVALLRDVLLAELQTAARAAPAGAGAFERAMRYYARLFQLLPEEKWIEVATGVAFIESPEPIEGNETDSAMAGPAGAPCPSPEVLAAAIAAILSARTRLGERAALLLAAAVLASARTKSFFWEDLREAFSRTLGFDPLRDAPNAVTRLFNDEFRAPPTATFAPSAVIAQERKPDEMSRREAAPQAFALMAGNAGLVLLHPFLPTLLEACGLYEPRGALEPRALPRAAALLHWLANGRDEVYEFELGAIKLLLGLRPEVPLPMGAEFLGESERDEGAALLRATIGHWKALKGTSIDGLRVSFLQRHGALREEEAGWRLQLEAESFDVLLKQLPWDIATVKLPWMTRPLYTDWPTL